MFSFFIYRKDIKLCEEQNHHYRKRLCYQYYYALKCNQSCIGSSICTLVKFDIGRSGYFFNH